MGFEQKVVAAIRQIPHGQVATYGQIAAIAGSPRSALIVGQILRTKTDHYQLPWQRVINSRGRISIINIDYPAQLQAELLKSEGVPIEKRGNEYWVDLRSCQWRPEA